MRLRPRRLVVIALTAAAAAPTAASALSSESFWIANFAHGTAGTSSYERISFVLIGKRPSVAIRLGRSRTQVTLAQLRSPRGVLNLRFPNGWRIRVRVVRPGIRVWRRDTNVVTTFRWTDDSPILGSRSGCSVCVSRPESRAFLERYFLNGRA